MKGNILVKMAALAMAVEMANKKGPVNRPRESDRNYGSGAGRGTHGQHLTKLGRTVKRADQW